PLGSPTFYGTTPPKERALFMPSRNQTSNSVLGTYYSYDVPSTVRGDTFHTEGSMIGAGHYGYPDFPPDRNVGGDWSLDSKVYTTTSDHAIVRGGSTAYTNHHYSGDFIGSFDWPGFLPGGGDGTAWGPQAYSKMKPTKPIFSGLNAIYELREVPAMLRQRFLKDGLHSIPNYWLALQFGWKPLLSDIIKTVTFQRAAQKRLAWLLQHNGKPVRRRVDLASTSTTIDTGHYGGGPYPGFVDYFYRGPRTSSSRRIETDHVWASARFRYWLPDGPRDINWNTAMLARLYGLYPSPSVIWNALPWTWLADWFHTAGDVLENMDGGVANRLAADYFYVMREKKYVSVVDSRADMFSYPDYSPVSVNVSATREIAYKSRLAGDPFGFHSQPTNLSAMQLSIIGALGLSRLR
ncbi:TPA_asm: maturation protein, partial [ssRNA phage Esthiorhiza.2_22]